MHGGFCRKPFGTYKTIGRYYESLNHDRLSIGTRIRPPVSDEGVMVVETECFAKFCVQLKQ